MKARDVMEAIKDALHEDDTIRTAINKMRVATRRTGWFGVKGLVVLDSRSKLVGMLSMEDILQAIVPIYLKQSDLRGFTWDGMLESMALRIADKPISEIMHREVITVPEEAPLMECAELMINRNIHRLPVLDSEGKVSGMVYLRDLYYAITKVLHDDKEDGHGS